jgi:TRAP-type C4-dicarboxylate transport system substrate-binding protein
MIRRLVHCIVAVAASLFAWAAHAAEYRWLNSWDRTFPPTTMLVEPMLKAVEAASDGKMKFLVSGPETVPAFEQLQPVTSGAFQFLFTHGAYHFGTSPLAAAVEALTGTPEQRMASGVFEAVDKHYQKLGLKIIAWNMTVDGAYNIVLRRPPTPKGDLEGFKIRGNPTYLGVLQMLGASMVTMPASEIYTGLEKGVVDGFCWPSYGIVQGRFHEPARYFLRPAFGFGTFPVFVHLATWNRLSPAERKIILDEAAKAEARWFKDSARLMADEEKALASHGLQRAQIGEAYTAKLQRAWSDGLWQLSAQKFKKEVEEIRGIARAKGID